MVITLCRSSSLAWLRAGVTTPKTKLSCPVVLAYLFVLAHLPVSSPTNSTVPLSQLGTENPLNLPVSRTIVILKKDYSETLINKVTCVEKRKFAKSFSISN